MEELIKVATDYAERNAREYLSSGFKCDNSEELEDAFVAGADWMKEQMMKDAVDSDVKWCNHGYPDFPIEDLAVLDEIVLPKEKFKIGDKVKVVIIKE